MREISRQSVHGLLEALGEQLVTMDASFGIAVIGGSALLAVGLRDRVTRDVMLSPSSSTGI